MCLGDFIGHVGRRIDGFDEVHGRYGVGHSNLEGRTLLEFCLEKELCQIRGLRERKMTFRMRQKLTLCL